ncbi:MAG: putative transporter transrane protein [Frankiales bacterium]|jgi:ABC-2 type transport system permease protein|nr:putative transporter transrane protein [Frankiales bacterium]
MSAPDARAVPSDEVTLPRQRSVLPGAPAPAARPVAQPRPAVPSHPVTARRVLASEWVKFRSLRSTAWTLLSAVLLMIGIGWLAGWGSNDSWADLSPQEQATFSPVDITLAGFYLAQLAVSVLGVLLVTGEYATGMVRATFAAVPRRLPVLWAKAVLFAGVSFLSMLAAAAVSFAGGQQLLDEHGIGIHDAGVVRGIVGVAGYLAAVAVLAVALGFVLRSTAGGVATMCGLLLVAPTLGLLLPKSWQHLLPYLPSNAGAAVFSAHPSADSLGAVAGSVTLGLWLLAALLAAAWTLSRRDV